MRTAIISDIHGNYEALQSVLSDIRSQGCDQIVCLGDTATIGPQPLEVLYCLMELDCRFIMGNHDAAILDPGKADQYHIAPPLIPSLHWCAAKLRPDHLEFLQQMSATLQFGKDRESLLCFHGSPLSTTDMLLPDCRTAILEKYFKGYSAAVFAGGHSHLQMFFSRGPWTVINPGSVGAAFKKLPAHGEQPQLNPWAEYAVIEYKNRNFSADLRRISFDLKRYKSVLYAGDLPVKQWWLEQYP